MNKVYFIGAGPGKSDLITVRGLNILKSADVIIYDYLVDKQLLETVKEGAELICSDELGKRRYAKTDAQPEINRLLVERAKEGKRIARLKGGDASIFSRISEELEALSKNGIDFEIVPGVTAASAASSFTGIPLTDRDYASSCLFVTGTQAANKDELDWKNIAKQPSVVFYMGVKNLEIITKRLIKAKKAKTTPIAIAQDVSLPTEKLVIGTLNNIVKRVEKAKIRPPAIIIVGEVVRYAKKFNPSNKGRHILFTGLSKERFFLDGSYQHVPLIKIRPLKDYTEFDKHLKEVNKFDWIVFGSRYGVEYFFKRLKVIKKDSRALYGKRIAVVGESTKTKLLDFGIDADLVPEIESSKGLLSIFKKENIKDKNIFLPRSDLSDKGLAEALTKLGAKVTTSFAYSNVIAPGLPDIDMDRFDEIMFTSPSTVRSFKKRYKRLPKNVKVSCIGDVTLKEAKRCKLLN
ncbi:MAG: uroporphyrinogen-III C-methyltransferase [Candidatus Omnitrophica bacterium]|nr:uroporphyrinogen-III C-methyltransferase [Candidatus Omnitrophota bacterium]